MIAIAALVTGIILGGIGAAYYATKDLFKGF